MKREEINKHIEKNKSKLPLQFNNFIHKDVVDDIKDFVYSKKYKDGDYSPLRFYKPITRF